MFINLCNEQLMAQNLLRIECSHICSDSHSVNNLISNNQCLRRNGFRTEHFIRPPIEITIKSKFKFDIKQIDLGLKLNDNKSESIEIYSSKTIEPNYQLITKQYNCLTSDSLCIRNVCFRPNSTLNRLIPSTRPTTESPTNIQLIKCFKNCLQLQAIKIKILRTTNSSIPCLSYLNILCQPIRQTPADILAQILDIYSTATETKQDINNKSISTKTISFYNSSDETNSDLKSDNNLINNKRKIDSINSRETESEFAIPEEFIDSITNEIMIDPIVLPSGHSVDKTTLDKYLSEESKWCRQPSDPFTQLLFTNERQPKPNTILRQRIDEYLSQITGQSLFTSDERLESSTKRRIVGYNHINNCNNNKKIKLISSKLLLTNSRVNSNATDTVANSTGGTHVVPVDRLLSADSSCRHKCVDRDHHSISATDCESNAILYKLFCNHLICRPELLNKLDKHYNTIKCSQCDCVTQTDEIIKLNRI